MSASGEPEKVPAAAEGEEKADGAKDAAGSGGELLYCGATNFETMGRKVVGGAQGNLVSPTRMRSLMGVDIRFVASGCSESPRPSVSFRWSPRVKSRRDENCRWFSLYLFVGCVKPGQVELVRFKVRGLFQWLDELMPKRRHSV
jgi:hypothetical protein